MNDYNERVDNEPHDTIPCPPPDDVLFGTDSAAEGSCSGSSYRLESSGMLDSASGPNNSTQRSDS